jgi:hypothetical protein
MLAGPCRAFVIAAPRVWLGQVQALCFWWFTRVSREVSLEG